MSGQKKNSRVLRDLIRIGVFSALLIVVEFIIACTLGYIPPLMLTLMPCILGCVSGIIYVAMLSKLTIRGGILIGSALFGLCMINMVPYAFMFFTCLAGGILGELAYYIVGKTSFKGQVTGICMVALAGAVGQYAPFIFMQDAYLALYADNSSGTLPVVEYGIEHVTIPFALVVTVFYIGFTIFGCFWGKKIVEKHFKKARTK